MSTPRIRFILETLLAWQHKEGGPISERMMLKGTQAGYREVRDALEYGERHGWVSRRGDEGPWEVLPFGGEVLTSPRKLEAAFPNPNPVIGPRVEGLDYAPRLLLGALEAFKRAHPDRSMPTQELLLVVGLHYEPAYEAAEVLRDAGLVRLIDLDEGPRGKVPIDFELDLPAPRP